MKLEQIFPFLEQVQISSIFSHLNIIALLTWIAFLLVVAIRFFYPTWVKNISYFNLILLATGLRLFYGLLFSFGQYYVWATSSDFTRTLVNSSLPKQVPFPELFRPLFENHLGYFLFYIFGHIWLDIFISFLVSIILFFLFKVWKMYRGGFLEQGPELLLILMLVSGWPGILILIPLGFIFSIFLFAFYYFKGDKIVNIEPAFIFASIFSLLFTRVVSNML